MAKNRANKVLCGRCKQGFRKMSNAVQHVEDKHQGSLVHLYTSARVLDLREPERQSIASQMIEQQMNADMGEPVDDWAADLVEYDRFD